MHLLPLIIMITLTTVVYAEEQDACESAGSKQSLASCTTQKFENSDIRLNQVYQTLLAAAKNQTNLKKHIINTQRLWLKYFQASCQFEAGFSVADDVYWQLASDNTCRTRLTLERTAQLQYYNCLLTKDLGSCDPAEAINEDQPEESQ